MNPSLLLLIGLSIIAISLLLLLVFGRPKRETSIKIQASVRKFPVKTVIIVIAVIVITGLIIGLFLTGDKKINAESVIETGKGIITKEPEIPVFTDDFNRQNLGENWRLGTGKWQIENGELVGENTGLDAWMHLMRYFEADKIVVTFDAWIESEEWKPKAEIGCYFYDNASENDYYPILLFDGQANIFDKRENPLWQPFATGMLRSNKIYCIKATRKQQQEKACLSLVVSDKNGKIIANGDKKVNSGRKRVKIGFFSFNVIDHSQGSTDRVHIDNLKIYAYTT